MKFLLVSMLFIVIVITIKRGPVRHYLIHFNAQWEVKSPAVCRRYIIIYQLVFQFYYLYWADDDNIQINKKNLQKVYAYTTFYISIIIIINFTFYLLQIMWISIGQVDDINFGIFVINCSKGKFSNFFIYLFKYFQIYH